jgi:hypothetical protein
MTDSIGIFQHAKFAAPNHPEGYCTDDNARGLILAVQRGQLEDHMGGKGRQKDLWKNKY